MPVMDNIQRRRLHEETMSEQCTFGGALRGLSILKGQLRQVMDLIDEWHESNFVSFDTTIPVLLRNRLSKKQKMFLYAVVAFRRWRVE